MLNDALAGFRAALHEQVARPDESLRMLLNAVAALANVARASGMPVEQFVVLVKREWYGVVEGGRHDSDDSAAHQRLQQSVVTAAIKAYYMQ